MTAKAPLQVVARTHHYHVVLRLGLADGPVRHLHLFLELQIYVLLLQGILLGRLPDIVSPDLDALVLRYLMDAVAGSGAVDGVGWGWRGRCDRDDRLALRRFGALE